MSGCLEPGENAAKTRLQTARSLDELIEQHEAINWRDVDGISSAEAAAWTDRLIEAHKNILKEPTDV